MIPPIEQRRAELLARFPEWVPMTLDGRLDHCAEEFGDRPFVLTDDRSLTYAETVEWSQRLASGLVALGVAPGDRVGLLMANYLEFVPLKFAIARAGAVAIPSNYLYRQDELAYVLDQSQCSVLITMTSFAGLDYLGMLDAISPGWEGDPRRKMVLFPTDGRARPGVLTVDQLGAEHMSSAVGGRRHPDDIGDMLYTSGTTGSPKGVLVTHDAVQRTAFASALTRAFEDRRRILFSLPCYHMFGYVEGLLAAMMVGGAIIPQTAFDPAAYFAGIERHRATEILCVPTMTVALLEHEDRKRRDLDSLFAILSGAAPAPVWLWERVRTEFGVTDITTGYGMTECGGAMTMTLPEDPLELQSATVGRPKMAGPAGLASGDLTEYRVIDPMSGEPLPEGAEGEFASLGPTNMVGFWNKPEETALVLKDGWVRSGDLGRIRPDGYLQLTGRSKELYKSGGELVMPKEIEELLSQHPDVGQAYAVGVTDEKWGELGCVWVVRAPGATVTADELLALCKDKLARFKVPKHVLFIDGDQLPTTPTGKVQKFKLAQMASSQLS